MGISGSFAVPMHLGKSRREELSAGKNEFEENGSEGKPYQPPSAERLVV
jgi:hypothetical protein